MVLEISAVGFVLFIRWEKHREQGTAQPCWTLDCFLIPRFRGGNITAVAVAIGEFAIIFVLPLYLINALDLSTMSAGLVLAAMAIGAFFSGAAARRVAARYGAPGAVVQALSEGLTNAAQWSLVAATAFLALGFVGALRVRRAAGRRVPRKQRRSRCPR